MTVKREPKVLLSLLAHELFQRKLEIDASAVEWAEVLAEGDRHAVTALLYPGIRQLSDVPEDVLAKTRGAAITASIASENMLKSQRDILELLEAKRIPCAVLKGASVACFYPHPELRTPGDIDILTGEKDIEQLKECLMAAGFSFDHETEMHQAFYGLGALVEIHRTASMFPDLPKGKYAAAFMGGALEHRHEGTLSGVAFPCLDFPYQMISLLAHIERHMRSAGIGLRQICDWAATIHAHRDDFGEKELDLLDQCGLLCFAKVVTGMCEKYLGLPPFSWCRDVSQEDVDGLAADILTSGNFHAQEGIGKVSAVMLGARFSVADQKMNILRNYRLHVRYRIETQYQWAKNPLWQPLFWVYFPVQRALRVLSGRRKKVSLRKALQRARGRQELIRRLKLYQ